MFRGSYVHSLDDKSRLIVPLKFRSRLGESFVVTRGLEGCLFVFPEEQYRAFIDVLQGKVATPAVGAEGEAARPVSQEHIDAWRTFQTQARQLQRFFMAEVADVQADSQGRIALPAKLREHAGIRHEAVIVGVGNRIEIWARERWEELNSGLSDQAVMAAAEAIGIV